MKKLKLEGCAMCPHHKTPPHLTTRACSKTIDQTGNWKAIYEDDIRTKVYYEEEKYIHTYEGVFPDWCPLENYE